MEIVLSNLERIAGYLLGAGALLFVIAFAWLMIAAFRGARARGPLILFLLAGGIAVLPAAISALNGPVADLGRPVRLLNSELQIGFHDTVNQHQETLRVKARALVQIAGFAVGFAALFWLAVLAFRQWAQVKWPVYLFLLAALLLALPFAVNHLLQRYIDLGPRERLVNGEPHLTLTGWDHSDYSILRFRPQTVVLQMANPDVTDDTLQYLADMHSLRNLDLGDTQVTDAGLARLAGLRLESLRLTRTKVTDAGFREHLVPIDTLMKLDLSGTAVSADAVQEWRTTKPGRKALR